MKHQSVSPRDSHIVCFRSVKECKESRSGVGQWLKVLVGLHVTDPSDSENCSTDLMSKAPQDSMCALACHSVDTLQTS
ncbi:hypothetical protein E2C01_017656 [Portunus trituberculatus]|uniref:Uncharacterized protein n=1 Tax=Portunus trituberculatus TaxID=210409 RepID=A0A5B7DSJ3_PORTR|nr:hypothetical protein [Portunus trituberculatus]